MCTTTTTQDASMNSQKLELEVKQLKVQVKNLKLKLKEQRILEKNYDPLQVEIVGTWKPTSLKQLKKFSKEQERRFRDLLAAETNEGYIAKFEIIDGDCCVTGERLDGWYEEEEHKYRQWTTTYTSVKGEVQKVVRTIENRKLKMVLEVNGEKCTIFFARVETEKEEDDEAIVRLQRKVDHLQREINDMFFMIRYLSCIIFLLIVGFFVVGFIVVANLFKR